MERDRNTMEGGAEQVEAGRCEGSAMEKNDECQYTPSTSPPVEVAEEATDDVEKISSSLPVNERYKVPRQNQTRCQIHDKETYEHMYWRSLHDADSFWREQATEILRWTAPFTKVFHGRMEDGNVSWFLNGKLNVCDNCVDRWAEKFPNRVALICEGDDPDQSRTITYRKLLRKVCQFANMLKRLGVRKGDVVSIYLPMGPEIVYAMLACARIGAVHNVIFAGFAASSLAERIHDAESRILITADQSSRGGKTIFLKDIADEAMTICPQVRHLVVFRCKGEPLKTWVEGRDIWGNELMSQMQPYCPLEVMDSEDPLFILYTSGSTGKPKGLCHSTAGYLLYAALTHKCVFDYHPGDIYACVADCGWITGHSYVVYGPLCNGATTLLFQSIPTYPDPGRYWQMIEKWKASQFYTAPTALRALMRYGDSWPKKYELSSLRVLGTVGEPINPEAWRWYASVIGQNRCSVVDTYWQTETGGHVLTPIPGATVTKPGSATLPFFGIEPVVLDPISGEEKKGNNVCGVLCIRRLWPGVARSVHGAHLRLMSTYYWPYKGYFFTGDGVFRDADGYYWITGRVDDTLNVSGHRLTTAEIEHALVQHDDVAEAAVVGVPHEVKGSGIFCFAILKEGVSTRPHLQDELKRVVRKYIGPIATPDYIVIARDLPKTKSGKIMRRLLRKIAALEIDDFGDTSTLVNSHCLESLIIEVKMARGGSLAKA
ncbi:UNVERIFIED_CONTAM: Acetyl-coenzyme A synthetase 2, putative [Hammondia hammondi]|eukprot:XP_008888426.1 Acetyl-coenzyme A synthetase 2, putative [Hammondia hammondi]